MGPITGQVTSDDRLIEVGEPPFRRLLVALHGYGGTGPEIAAKLAPAIRRRGVLIFSPSGAADATLASTGRAWYSLTSRVEEMGVRARPAAAALIPRIAALRERHDIHREQTCMVAFSQGTTVAAEILRDNALCGGAALICGRIPPHHTAVPVPARPRVLVIAGENDPFATPDAVRADVTKGLPTVPIQLRLVAGLGHELRADIAAIAVAFAIGRPLTC